MIYLDHNATTPIAPEVAEAMVPYAHAQFGNPSSNHVLGRTAKEAVENARQQVASLLGCLPREIVFTSGGTESNNMVLKGVAHSYAEKGRHIITTAIEHPAITNPCMYLIHQGFDVTFLPVDAAGQVSPSAVKKAIKPTTILISVMHANNETGTIQPISEIGKIARNADILFHTDAAQSAGKIPVETSELLVDFASIAGHKMYAPKGIGALFMRDGLKTEPFMHGAGQESGRRAGTENVMFAVALGKACSIARRVLPVESPKMAKLGELLYTLLSEEIPNLVLNGHQSKRLPNTLNVLLPGIDGSALLDAVPDICASTGAACHERSVTLSHVLAAMGISKAIGRGAIRLTLGRKNTEEEIQKAAKSLVAAYNSLTS